MLPRVAFTSFASRFREPRTDEGFESVTVVPFQASALTIDCAMARDLTLTSSFEVTLTNFQSGKSTGCDGRVSSMVE